MMSRILIEKIKSLVISLLDSDEQKRLVGSLVRKTKRVMQIHEDLEKGQSVFAKQLFGGD